MNKFLQIYGFKGGTANSLYDPLDKQTYQSAKDLDVFTSLNILSPHYSIANDITDKTPNKTQLNAYYKGSDGVNYFKGFDESTGAILTIWDASSGALGSTVSLTAETTAKGTSATHGMVEFLSNLWYWQSSTVLARFNFSTITSDVLTSISSLAPIFVHRGLAKMFYTVSNYQIGASLTTTPGSTPVLTFDASERPVQMAEYGRFVVIGVNNVNASAPSRIVIWDGSSTTIDDSIDLGDTGIQSVVNVNGIIYILTSTNPNGWGAKNLIRIYRLSGSQVKMVREIDLQATTTGAVTIATQAVIALNGRIYFGMTASSATTVMTIDNGVYCYDTQQDILTIDRITSDTTAIAITSVGFNGGAMVVTWYDGTNYVLSHIISSPSVSALGVYESNAFPLRDGLPAKIKRIIINHKPIPTSTGFTVQVKHYGHYTWGTSVPAEDSFVNLITPEGFGSGSKGLTQSTDYATITEITGNELFKTARYAQIKIKFDEVSGTTAPSLVFPILIEVGE